MSCKTSFESEWQELGAPIKLTEKAVRAAWFRKGWNGALNERVVSGCTCRKVDEPDPCLVCCLKAKVAALLADLDKANETIEELQKQLIEKDLQADKKEQEETIDGATYWRGMAKYWATEHCRVRDEVSRCFDETR